MDDGPWFLNKIQNEDQEPVCKQERFYRWSGFRSLTVSRRIEGGGIRIFQLSKWKNWFGFLWKCVESFHRSNQFHFAVFWSNQCYKFWKKKFRKKLVDARNNLIDMHLIQSLKNKFSIDLPLFPKYPATSIKRLYGEKR